jgi:hypothetical protein
MYCHNGTNMTNKQIIRDASIEYESVREIYEVKKKAYETLCPNIETGHGHIFEKTVEKEWNGSYREAFYVTRCTLCGHTI